ncbi:aminopeptidase [bacterium]|nr:aminopeptidase [candidate division CSSED10-310 bacterium]
MTIAQIPFTLHHSRSQEMTQAAMIALKIALNLQSGERILIMANPDGDLPVIAQSVYNAALEIGACPTLLFQPARSRVDFAEQATLAAISTEPEVMFSITRESLGNDPRGLTDPYKKGSLTFNHIFYYLIATQRTRGAWCPAADLDTFCRTVPVDYEMMWVRARELNQLFDAAESIHITTPAGTDLFIDMEGVQGMLDDGDYRYAGHGGNLPAGEVFCVPARNSYGLAVIDGTASLLNGTLIPKNPFTIRIEQGQVVVIEGKEEADRFKGTLEEMRRATEDQITRGIIASGHADTYRRNCLHLAEFGVGLNESARIVGNMTEDEKALNTCHIAVGDDCYGQAPAVAHLDCIMRNPTIEIALVNGKSVRIEPKQPKI